MSQYKSICVKSMFTYTGIKKNIFEKSLNPLAKEGWELIEINSFNNTLFLQKNDNQSYEYKLIHLRELFNYNFIYYFLFNRLLKKAKREHIFEETLNPLAQEGWELVKIYKLESLLILKKELSKNNSLES